VLDVAKVKMELQITMWAWYYSVKSGESMQFWLYMVTRTECATAASSFMKLRMFSSIILIH